jgi:type IV pilus assembly protein PilQ
MPTYLVMVLVILFSFSSAFAEKKSEQKSQNTIQGDNKCLSLDFKDLPITDAFRIYFDATHQNFILDKAIKANPIELHLECVDSVNVFNALVALGTTIDVKRSVDGITYLTPKLIKTTGSSGGSSTDLVTTSVTPLFKDKPKEKEIDKEKEPDTIRLIKVYNSTASDVVAAIAVNTQQSQLIIKPLSDSNSVYLAGQKTTIDLLEKAIALIDKPRKQFMIRARLISTSDTFLENLGTTFGTGIKTGDIDASAESAFTTVAASATGGASIIFQKAGNIMLNAKVSAALTNGDASLITEPRTVAYENKQSSINQGVRIPYQTQQPSNNGYQAGYQTTFVDAALILQVTPRLGDDKNRIILDVYFSKNSVGASTSAGMTIETREIRTTIALKSGETVMLGGIDETTENTTDTGVPVLKDIPILGYAFGATSEDKKHNKIVLFITPTLL